MTNSTGSRKSLILLGLLALLACNVWAAPSSTDTVKKTDDENVPGIAVLSADDGKWKDSELSCDQTEYSEYIACVTMKQKQRRDRRTVVTSSSGGAQVTMTDDSTNSIPTPCVFERNRCVAGCAGDSACVAGCQTCEEGTVSPQAVLCPNEYYTCVQNCPTSLEKCNCDSLCSDESPVGLGMVPEKALGYKTVIFENDKGERYDTVQVPIGIPHNITTIIKLNNFINATNNINAPTTFNNTNINTLNLNTNATTGGAFGLGQTTDGACCFAVQPKSCRTSTSGLRCHHRRRRTCGKHCTSRVIHSQTQRNCQSNGRCHSETAYVSEPNSRCYYSDQWPYVSCGGSRSQSRNCNGCYDHYYGGGYGGYQAEVPRRCYSCYDGGYDNGPMYRHGPVYQPNYYHEPSCYLTGTCAFPGYDGFGQYPPRGMQPNAEKENEYYGEEEQFPGEDEFSGAEPVDGDLTQYNEAEWDEVVKKCKVVNVDENTVIVKNCTESNVGSNPYATNRVDEGPLEKGSNAATDKFMAPPQAPFPGPYLPYYNYFNYYQAPPPPFGYYGGPQMPMGAYPSPAQYYRGPGRKMNARNGARTEVDRPLVDDDEGKDFWDHDEEDFEEKGFVMVDTSE